MAKYKLKIKKSAQKEMRSMPKKDLKKIIKGIEELASDPRGHHCKKLSNDEKYRKRVGSYRILYEIVDDILFIYIVRVAHRREVYR